MSRKQERKERLKDIGALAGGAALGGGLGYLAARKALKANHGFLRYGSPTDRLKVLVPAATLAMGGAALASTIRSRAKEKRKQMHKKAMLLRRYHEISYYS